MKILITQDTFVPAIDGAQHCAANSVVDVETDTAHAVVSAGKGLYVDPKDDRSRAKGQTASEARIEAVRAALKANKKAEG